MSQTIHIQYTSICYGSELEIPSTNFSSTCYGVEIFEEACDNCVVIMTVNVQNAQCHRV